MVVSRKMLRAVYVLIGAVALVGCWGNNIQLMGDSGLLGANLKFWELTLANPASRSITVDILALGLAAIVWMLLEARRLGMPGVWLWVLFGVFIAMGAAFPWFLAHRETVLARSEGGQAGTLGGGDVLGVAVLAAAILAYTGLALSR